MAVTVKLGPLLKLSNSVKAQIASAGASGAFRNVAKQMAMLYRSFIQERFDRYSKGGGDWKRLSPATIAGRRKGKGGGTPSILRDTGTLFHALDPVFAGQPGALEEMIPGGIRVGFGGNKRYADGGAATVADIATFHDQGGKGNRPPQRRILVDPSEALTKRMASLVEAAMVSEIKSSGEA